MLNSSTFAQNFNYENLNPFIGQFIAADFD
jgi:hypothetical protein